LAGYHSSPGWNRDYQKIQILTIEDLLAGKDFDYPRGNVTLSRAERVQEEGPEQKKLL